MAARIAAHRARRDAGWQTIEAPHELPEALDAAPHGSAVLVDCLTLWLTNLLCAEDNEQRLQTETNALYALLPQLGGDLILVSNETGLGVVPLGELTRRYVDEAGRLHQRLAVQMQQVIFMIAGLPQVLKAS